VLGEPGTRFSLACSAAAPASSGPGRAAQRRVPEAGGRRAIFYRSGPNQSRCAMRTIQKANTIPENE
jgi:hypothetical protein